MMKKDLLDFMIDATNVYRTKKYIVKQNLYLDYEIDNSSILYSKDVYYLRNKKIDKLFNLIFQDRQHIDGKRVHSTSYSRKYIQ